MQSNHTEFDRLLEVGLSPIPLKAGSKAPSEMKWQKYSTCRPSPDDVKTWKEKYTLKQIGLALGTPLKKGGFLVAVDVDAEDMVPIVRSALGLTEKSPAKIGKKGITYFVRTQAVLPNMKIKRKDGNNKSERKPSVEFLSAESQTVIPPSIHPDTQLPYQWLGTPLPEAVEQDILPYLDASMIDEITAICQNKGAHFLALNDMVWLGAGKGGDTHDTCVASVANMVARNWDNASILRRIKWAKEEACIRAGENYNWPEADRVISEWIESARSKGMTGKATTERKVPPERVMADWVIDQLGGIENTACVRTQLRSYRNGHWATVDLSELTKKMYAHDPCLRKKDAESALAIAHSLSQRPNFGTTPGLLPKDDPKRQRICLQNGTLSLLGGNPVLEKWDPDHEVLDQLAIEWDAEAQCPTYLEVLDRTFNSDPRAIATWNEFVGLSLVDDMSFQKMLFLMGPGGNGKGTVARVLQNLHSPSSVSSISITSLNEERARTSLVGKRINISGEQSRMNLISDTYLKKITGEDAVDVRLLYKELNPYVFMSVRFLELVNEMPQTSDTSHALRRRMMILECPNKVVNPDRDLDRKLKSELPGILRLSVEALRDLYKRGRFDPPTKSDELVDEYLKDNDPVSVWLRDTGFTTDEWSPTGDLYSDFSEWMKLNGYRYPMSSVHWGKRMNALGHEVKVIKGSGGASVRVRQLKLNSNSRF